MSSRHQDNHRQLSADEVDILKSQGCSAEDWNNIFVRPDTDIRRIRQVHFIGRVRIGNMNGLVSVSGLGDVRPQIMHCTIADTQIGDDNYISDVSLLSGYVLGDKVVLVSCGRIIAADDMRTRYNYGIGVRVAVVNEAGGREVAMSTHLSSNIAYIVAMHAYRPHLRQEYERLVDAEAAEATATPATMGRRVSVYNTATIDHVRIGAYTTIEGATLLRNGTILSVKHQSTYIGSSVSATDFIAAEGAKIDGGAQISRSFIGQCSHIGGGFFAEDLLAFACCQLLCGEAISVFAGPYTVSHHKTTLLIAGAYSFFNGGSATNASNHHYRLGPSHQVIFERGVKTGSGSYLLEPAHIGAFSLVVGHHKTNPDTTLYPFSVIAERDGESHLLIAQNLRTVGIFRDSRKWQKRDLRTLSKRDCITFDVLNPITVGQMIKAVRHIEEDLETQKAEIIVDAGIRIRRALLPRAVKAYTSAIDFYLGKAYLNDKGMSDGIQCDWIDCGGLIAPRPEVEAIEQKLSGGKYSSVEEIGRDFQEIHIHSWETARLWAVGAARSRYAYTNSTDDMPDATQRVAEASRDLKESLLADASREWNARLRTGYGIDGSEEDARIDYQMIHGKMEDNVDIIDLQKHYDEQK